MTATTHTDPGVLDVSLFGSEQRSVQYLSCAGLLKGDDCLTSLNLVKRLNHAAYADYRGDEFDDDTGRLLALWQKDFQRKLGGMSFDQLIAEGHVNKILEGMLEALANYHKKVVFQLDSLPVRDGSMKDPAAFNCKHERAEQKCEKYMQELKYWREHPDVVKETARKYHQALECGRYLPIGQLAVTCGMVDGDARKANDMVEDALANACAHSLKLLAKPFEAITDGEFAQYKADQQSFALQIKALAARVADATEPLDKAQPYANATPELGRIQAVKSLLSAQLNAAVTGTDDPATLAEMLSQMKPQIRDYQSAAMSLAHAFLGEGAGAGDPRMQTLRTQLKGMMDKDNIPLLAEADAERKLTALARDSGEDLLQVAGGNLSRSAKLHGLLEQIDPHLAKQVLSPKPHFIGGTTQAVVGAFLKMGERLKHVLGMQSEPTLSL